MQKQWRCHDPFAKKPLKLLLLNLNTFLGWVINLPVTRIVPAALKQPQVNERVGVSRCN